MDHEKTVNGFRRILLLGVLATAAVAGNAIHLPLFFSVSFIFGSIFALIALRLLGIWPGVLIAAIGSSYTIILWGHPYACLIFTLEALVVGLLIRRGHHMPIADLAFWCVIGAPMAFVLYWGQLGMAPAAATLIAVKQPVNGIFNSVVAAILLTIVSLKLPNLIPLADRSRTRLAGIVFNLVLLLTILTGTLPIILDSNSLREQEEAFVERLLDTNARWIKAEIAYHSKSENALGDRELIIAEEYFDLIESGLKGTKFGLFDMKNRAVAQSFDLRSTSLDGIVVPVSGDLNLWQPDEESATMLRYRRSRYFKNYPITINGDELKLVIEYDAAPVVQKLDSHGGRLLGITAILMIAAVVAAYFASRFLVRPVRILGDLSSAIVDKVKSDEPLPSSFPQSQIAEFDELSNGLRVTTEKLREAFNQLDQMRAGLEDQVEDRTRELRRMSMVASQTTTGVIITDVNGLTEWVNEAFERITGYDSAELVGYKPGDLLQGPDTSTETVSTIRDAVRDQRAFKVEILNYHKSGASYWVEIIGNPVTNGVGEIEGFIAIETDISERKRLQASKDEFVSTINHELRTPLTSLNGSLTLLESGALGELPEEPAGVVAIAKRNAERLLALVNDLLDIQKALTGNLNLNFETLGVDALIRTAIEENRSYAEQHGVDLIYAPAQEHLSVCADERRFIQVLTNLISNAAKFSPDGSEVRLSAEQLNGKVRIAVADSGPGIDETFHSRIFGRFAQADSSDSRAKGGTGLGLNICRSIVEEHGGSIGFFCPPAGGSVFYFDLPTERQPLDSRTESAHELIA
ncbi:MAG: ATP-binding protein [Rhodospirillales bacterium]